MSTITLVIELIDGTSERYVWDLSVPPSFSQFGEMAYYWLTASTLNVRTPGDVNVVDSFPFAQIRRYRVTSRP